MEIISPQNPKIKNIIKLRKARERKKQNLIVIEGRHEIHLAQISGIEIKELFLCGDFSSDKNFEIRVKDIEVFELDKKVFQKISRRENPDGHIALARPQDFQLDDIDLPEKPLVLILDRVEKPGNLGAILRSADGAGVDLVVVSDPQTDIFNPNVIRSSLGTVFSNKIATSSANDCQAWLKKNSITSVATTPRAKKSYTDIDYNQPIAIIIGTEHEGLTKDWLEAVDEKAYIPMKGKVDSLNASVSAGLLVYEAQKQRG